MISQEFLDLVETMSDLHRRKNAGYSGVDNPDAWANFRESENFGVPAYLGCLVRMSDKWTRIKNLLRSAANDQVSESIEDTMLDLAVYSLIFICLYRELHGRGYST
jgi:hypothetical protein